MPHPRTCLIMRVRQDCDWGRQGIMGARKDVAVVLVAVVVLVAGLVLLWEERDCVRFVC